MKSLHIFYLLVAALLVTCKSEPSKLEQTNQIQSIQARIREAGKPTPGLLDSLKMAYLQFSTAFPTDSMTANYLVKAAESAKLVGAFDEAISLYDKVVKEYPNKIEAQDAMFLKAFLLDNDLGKYDDAKAAYEAFLQRYPNNDYADDAQFLLENIGKSPEELIKSFETKSGQEAQ